MVSTLPALAWLLNVPHIVEKSFADTGFGIDDVSVADNGERYLPTVAQILQRAERDMQVGRYCFSREVSFIHNRGMFPCPVSRIVLKSLE